MIVLVIQTDAASVNGTLAKVCKDDINCEYYEYSSENFSIVLA